MAGVTSKKSLCILSLRGRTSFAGRVLPFYSSRRRTAALCMFHPACPVCIPPGVYQVCSQFSNLKTPWSTWSGAASNDWFSQVIPCYKVSRPSKVTEVCRLLQRVPIDMILTVIRSFCGSLKIFRRLATATLGSLKASCLVLSSFRQIPIQEEMYFDMKSADGIIYVTFRWA